MPVGLPHGAGIAAGDEEAGVAQRQQPGVAEEDVDAEGDGADAHGLDAEVDPEAVVLLRLAEPDDEDEQHQERDEPEQGGAVEAEGGLAAAEERRFGRVETALFGGEL